jgi:hypothetical protein
MNIKGLCRDCDIPTSNSDDEQWECRFFCEQDLQNMTQEELRSYILSTKSTMDFKVYLVEAAFWA